MFNPFKKKYKDEFKPSRFVKDYLIANNTFSEIDKMKLMMSNDLVKNLNLTINYDVLADVLKLLDQKYHQELRQDLDHIMPKPPEYLPKKEEIKKIQEPSHIPDKIEIADLAVKLIIEEFKSGRIHDSLLGQNGTIQDNTVKKE